MNLVTLHFVNQPIPETLVHLNTECTRGESNVKTAKRGSITPELSIVQ